MPDNIQGQGAPLSSTVGEIGCVYTDTITDKKYECISIHRYTTMKGPVVSYIWEAVEEEEGGKDPILCELVVTENGVYDEPMIGGGALEIAVGETIQFKKEITFAEDFVADLTNYGGTIVFHKDSAWQWIISGTGGVCTLACQSLSNTSEGFAYLDSMTAPMYGQSTPGWYKLYTDTMTFEPCDPPSITIEDNTHEPLPDVSEIEFLTDLADMFFAAPTPTPADGWNKVTVNVTGNSNEPNGKPIVVATSADMDAILANATEEDVGVFYLYQGETTETYTNGAVYSIQKEDS